MRVIQVIGFTLVIIAAILFYFMVSPISPNSANQEIASAGWTFTYIVTPMLYFSALLILPSTILLFSSKIRAKYYFVSKGWQTLWGVNILISFCYLALFILACFIM